MDCDDNDLYSQNLRLAEEGSNEFLPVLQPYALSKVDFGESLHGRFDSLVETGAFFGGQEHNQWIEEIHRGSSGIQYSSAVPQSCSIPRCGNVWSEATSLESVEMLLKSVGQEETIPVQTDTKELDTCDELGCILKQMDRGVKQGETSQSEKGALSVTDSQPIMPRKELLDSSFIVDMDVQQQKHQMKDSSPTYEGGTSVVGSLNNLTTINVDAHIHESSERSLSVDRKCNEVNEEDVKTVIDNSFDLKTQDSASGTKGKIRADGDQKFHTDHVKLNEEISQFRKDEASYSNADISETDKVDQQAEKSLSSSDVTVDKQVLGPSVVVCVASEVGNTLPSATAEPKGVASVAAISTVLEGVNLSGLSVHDSMLIAEHNATSEKNEVENFGGFPLQKEVDGSDIGHAILGINTETCNIDQGPSSTQDEASHMYAKNLVAEGGDGNKDEQDSFNEKKESIKLPSDSIIMCSDVGVSSMANKDNGFSQDKVIASKSHSDVSGGKSVTGFTSPNEEKATAATTSTEAGPSNLIASSEVMAGAGPMFESGNEVSMNAKETILEPVSNKIPSDSKIALDNKACQDSTNETQTCPVLNSSNKNEGNDTETHHRESLSIVSGVDSIKKGQAENGSAIVSEDPSSKSSPGTIDPEKQLTAASAVNADHSHSENDNNLIRRPLDQSVSTSRHAPPVYQDRVVSTSEASAPLELPGKKSRTTSRSPATRKPKKASQIVDKLLSTSSASQLETKSSQDLSLESPKESDVITTHSRSKSNTGRKPRRSSKTKGSDEKQNPVKEAGLDRRERINIVSQTVSNVHVQSNDIQRSTNTKQLVLAAPTSGLPDLNSSLSTSVVLQPFTDLQQVQLRAQIFVYGALIQGTVPDEAYMISAFGGLDGDRNLWEKAWHLCAERFRGQKSLHTTPNTSSHSRAGPAGHKASDQTVKQKKAQSKVTSSPAGQDSTKGSPVSLVNPVAPNTSPLWGIPAFSADALQSSGMPRGISMDYQRAYSPLRPHQSLPMHSVVGQSPWLSPFGSPWVTAAQTSSLDTIGGFPVQRPITEPVKLTSVKEMSLPQLAGMKHVPPASVGQSEPSTVSTLPHVPEMSKVTTSSVPHSTDPKPRKRKKNSVPDSHGMNIVHSKSQTAVPAYATSTNATTPPISFVSKVTTEEVIASATPTVSADLKSGGQDGREKAVLSYERVKEAIQQSDAAAALASAAVRHSEEVWDQLGKQGSSLLPDVETKLASAAVAVAAAAAVSKAAAAAASVASNAALQAKLMADEAAMELGMGTPGSIIKRNDETNNSNSSLVAAKEATSAASKRAENINAIIKAAELVAEAVSQAGKIVAMGDTLPLRDLLAAGPENYWKIGQATPELVSDTNVTCRQHLEVDTLQALATSSGHLEEGPSKQKETNYGRTVDGASVSGLANVNVVEDKEEHEAPDSSVTQTDLKKPSETSKEHGIAEGSHVEVFKDGNGFKAAWFLADILSIKDGKAYVIYSNRTAGEGLEKLKEWVPLMGEGDEAPRIRVSHPPMPVEGTRKRCRAAAGNHNWSIGDRVDAWIQESWWEGIITDKNKKDETMFTVHFPAHGETSLTQASHLRPSLMWKDGQWIEFTNPRENTHPSYGGDTPQRKRTRLQSPKVKGKGKDLVVSSAGAEESDKPTEPTLLDLSTSEKIFDVGKSSVDGNKQGNRHQMTRTGPLKEGSKVKFGVPKPGKKRKFMEVSKHYVAGHSENVDIVNEGNDLIKSAKFSTPQGLGLQVWRSARKTEPVEKRVAESKPKVPKPGKPPNVSSRTISRKGNSTADSASERNETNSDNNKVTSDAISEGEPKGKPSTAAGKLRKAEDKVMDTTGDAVEPRRSNRKIQPTSRLLEGLQSSLMVSKITSASSHEKRDHNRTASAHPKGRSG